MDGWICTRTVWFHVLLFSFSVCGSMPIVHWMILAFKGLGFWNILWCIISQSFCVTQTKSLWNRLSRIIFGSMNYIYLYLYIIYLFDTFAHPLTLLYPPVATLHSTNFNNTPLQLCSWRAVEGGCWVRWPVDLTCQWRLSYGRNKHTRRSFSGVGSLHDTLGRTKCFLVNSLNIALKAQRVVWSQFHMKSFG